MDLIASDTYVPNFLVKLFEMVDSPSTDACISWSGDGDSFVLKDQDALVKGVLQGYFKKGTLSTFKRQLNMYHFSRAKVAGVVSYNHVFFLKDHRHLLPMVVRKTNSAYQLKEAAQKAG